jgi:hypothetical protein
MFSPNLCVNRWKLCTVFAQGVGVEERCEETPRHVYKSLQPLWRHRAPIHLVLLRRQQLKRKGRHIFSHFANIAISRRKCNTSVMYTFLYQSWSRFPSIPFLTPVFICVPGRELWLSNLRECWHLWLINRTVASHSNISCWMSTSVSCCRVVRLTASVV